jgi:hypothetical protein
MPVEVGLISINEAVAAGITALRQPNWINSPGLYQDRHRGWKIGTVVPPLFAG